MIDLISLYKLSISGYSLSDYATPYLKDIVYYTDDEKKLKLFQDIQDRCFEPDKVYQIVFDTIVDGESETVDVEYSEKDTDTITNLWNAIESVFDKVGYVYIVQKGDPDGSHIRGIKVLPQANGLVNPLFDNLPIKDVIEQGVCYVTQCDNGEYSFQMDLPSQGINNIVSTGGFYNLWN